MNEIIATNRLDLIPLTPDFLRSTVAGKLADAESMLKLKIPDEWMDCADFAAIRLRDFEAGITSQPWMPRAIGLRSTGAMTGRIRFHSSPGPEDLADLSPEGVELGYGIFVDHRQQGCAREAASGLIKWAHDAHDIRSFIASVRPDNTPSLTIISKMGFRQIGSRIDHVDGYEGIFELTVG